VVVNPGLLGTDTVAVLPVSGDSNDEAVLAPLAAPESPGDPVAVHARKADVEEDGVGLEFLGDAYGGRPIVNRPNLMTKNLSQ
jgi:hypothetical protein